MEKICLPQTMHWRIFIYSAILALTGLVCSPQLNAEIYQWVDENGIKHYSNSPPAKAENVKILSGGYRYDEAADMRPQLINFVDVFWESEINRIRYKFGSGQWKRHNLEVSI